MAVVTPKIWTTMTLQYHRSGPHPSSGPSRGLVPCGLNPLVLQPCRFVDGRRFVVQRRVRSLRIVLHPPSLNCRPGLLDRDEPMQVQALFPESGVERLDKRVIRWRPRPAECQFDAAAMRPLI